MTRRFSPTQELRLLSPSVGNPGVFGPRNSAFGNRALFNGPWGFGAWGSARVRRRSGWSGGARLCQRRSGGGQDATRRVREGQEKSDLVRSGSEAVKWRPRRSRKDQKRQRGARRGHEESYGGLEGIKGVQAWSDEVKRGHTRSGRAKRCQEGSNELKMGQRAPGWGQARSHPCGWQGQGYSRMFPDV